jgi:hypothetical protein
MSIGLDRPPKQPDCLIVTAKVKLPTARGSHPDIGRRIARTEAERLRNVSLCFSRSSYKNLSQSNSKMGAREISVQLQRVLTFRDALPRALGQYLDEPQQCMAIGVVRDSVRSGWPFGALIEPQGCY